MMVRYSILKDESASAKREVYLTSYTDLYVDDYMVYKKKKHPVTYIDSYAWYGDNNLRSIRLPKYVDVIGVEAFRECSSLRKCIFPDELRIVGQWSFASTKLDSACFGEKLEWIDKYAFYRSGIRYVHIPKTIYPVQISDCAFRHTCSLLIFKIDLAYPPIISDNVFADANMFAKLIVPYGSKKEYERSSGWNRFKIIEECDSIIKR
ncbi:MAG: leucine-rich repeat domain-containing protein [Bacteroides sp.]